MAKLKTGRHTSALKENRQNIKKRKINNAKRTYLRTLTKQLDAAVAEKNLDAAKNLLKQAFSAFDTAAKTHLIHTKNADRKKAQLSKRITKIGA
ncbi:30S ribosomal protein S20 [bacterium]